MLQLALVFVLTTPAPGELVVVVSPDRAGVTLSAAELRRAFLEGRAHGKRWTPLVPPAHSKARALAERSVLRLPAGGLEAHWLAERIRGRPRSARLVASAADAAMRLRTMSDGIAIVPVEHAGGLPVIRGGGVGGAGTSLPAVRSPGRVAATLTRAVRYDRNHASDTIRLRILRTPGDAGDVDGLLRAFQGSGGDATFDFGVLDYAPDGTLAERLKSDRVDVLYVGRGASGSLAEVGRAARAAGVFTVTGHRSLVAGGLCLGVDLETGGRRLAIHTEACEAQGVKLRAALLRISDRIQP